MAIDQRDDGRQFGDSGRCALPRFDIDLGEDPHKPRAVNDDFDDASPSNIRALFEKADELLTLHKEVLDELIDIFNGEPKTDHVTLRGMAIA